jgi:hypothetical protein
MAQGFLYAPPLAALDFVKWLKHSLPARPLELATT